MPTGRNKPRRSYDSFAIQDIPLRTEVAKAFREAFQPREDCVMVYPDFSQLEMRLMAQLDKELQNMQETAAPQQHERTRDHE